MVTRSAFLVSIMHLLGLKNVNKTFLSTFITCKGPHKCDFENFENFPKISALPHFVWDNNFDKIQLFMTLYTSKYVINAKNTYLWVFVTFNFSIWSIF